MPQTSIREATQKRRAGPGTMLAGLVIFGFAAMLAAGNSRLYELRQENQRLQSELEERQDALSGLRTETSAQRARAEALGLRQPETGETVILHIRAE